MARLTVLITTALLLAAGAASAAETDRGRALYEARCDRCHDASVHGRNPRSARNFDQIRAFVARWDRELGTAWTVADIDAVARYLNDRYYHFPCPAEICKAAQARRD
jgi:mono/diheme cytochrome c family protein